MPADANTDSAAPTDTTLPTDSGPATDTAVPPADTAGPTCTKTGFEAGDQRAAFVPDEWLGNIDKAGQWSWMIVSPNGESYIKVSGTTSTKVGTYELSTTGSEGCDPCVSIHASCTELADDCAEAFVGTSGSLEITSLDFALDGAVGITFNGAIFSLLDKDSNQADETSSWCLDGDSLESTFSIFGGVGEQLPEFSALDQNGNEVSFESLNGTMGVLLWNFNEWCPYCVWASKASEAFLQEANAEDDRYDVSFIQLLMDDGIDAHAEQDDAAAWAEKHGVTYPVLHGKVVPDFWDSYMGQWKHMGLGLPAFSVVDASGKDNAFLMGFDKDKGFDKAKEAGFGSSDIKTLFEGFLEENPEWVKATPEPETP